MPSDIDFENMDPFEFELLVEKLIQKMCFTTKERKRTRDGGVDIFASNYKPIYEGKYVIQCKKYSEPVGVSIIRDLYGVVHSTNANKGILITNSTFTSDSKKFVKNKQIELINGDELIELLAQYNIVDMDEDVVIPSDAELVFINELLKPIEEIYDEAKDLKNEAVYLNVEDYSLDRWERYFENELDRFTNYIDSVEYNYTQLGQLLASQSKNTQQVRKYCEFLIDSTKRILENYKKSKSIQPPNKYSSAHKEFLKIYEEVFEMWNRFKNDYYYLIQNPENPKNVQLILDFEPMSVQMNIFSDELENINKSKSDGCFIVTAVYGTPLAPEIDVFRNYRDNQLRKTFFGRLFINIYYTISPSVANLITKSIILRKIINHLIIKPLLYKIK